VGQAFQPAMTGLAGWKACPTQIQMPQIDQVIRK
jgi:hypothetical protein